MIRLPALLPIELVDAFQGVEGSEELIDRFLTLKEAQQLRFFELVVEDGSWLALHPECIRRVALFFARAFIQRTLSEVAESRIVFAIQTNFDKVSSYLPKNLRITSFHPPLEGYLLPFARESVLFERIARGAKIVLDQPPQKIYQILLEFFERGEIRSINFYGEELLFDLLDWGRLWEMKRFTDLVEVRLTSLVRAEDGKRWIEALSQRSLQGPLEALFERCNQGLLGASLHLFSEGGTELLFGDLREWEVEELSPYLPVITHWRFISTYPSLESIKKLLDDSPRLVSISLKSKKAPPSTFFSILPATIRRFDLSQLSWLDDQHIAEIAERYRELRELRLEEIETLSLTAFEMIARMNLSQLHLVASSCVTREVLYLLFSSLPALEGFSLTHSTELHDRLLFILVRDHPDLTSLTLSYVTGITHQGVQLLVKLVKLETLSIDHLSPMDEGTIFSLILSLPRLIFVNIEKSCSLELHRLKEINRSHPHLTIQQ